MIEVRIRSEHDADGTFLCQWPSDRLDLLIPTLSAWGVYGHDGTEVCGNDGRLSGQIRIDTGAAYFEVVIAEDSDP